jgi:hypothetical protein
MSILPYVVFKVTSPSGPMAVFLLFTRMVFHGLNCHVLKSPVLYVGNPTIQQFAHLGKRFLVESHIVCALGPHPPWVLALLN